MSQQLTEWVHIAFRWVHVFAAFLWIGQTYYFTWLDARLREAEKSSDHPQLWMVHSGGFYVVDKKNAPDPGFTLHWFRWEAAITWISGLLLLVLVYYMGGLMNDDEAMLSGSKAIAAGIALLPICWLIYDFLWISPIGKNEKVGVVISYVLLVGLIFLVTRMFGGRAAYMHVGAVLGTLMAANVWSRILPAQKKMIAATLAGQTPDASLSNRAKQRSKQNTFMVIPVVFIMLSSHFPIMTYAHAYNWLILAALVLVGWGAAKVIREH